MKTDSKEAEKFVEPLNKADGHPLTKKNLEEEAADIMAKRQKAAEKIDFLMSEQDEFLPNLKADLVMREVEVNKAKTVLRVAIDECEMAKAALLNKSNQFDVAINNQKIILDETADPKIDEAITFFQDKINWLQLPGRISRIDAAAEKNISTMSETIKKETNADAVMSALKYCQNAIKGLEQLKLTPALNIQKIERMKAGIPEISAMLNKKTITA